jgi:hypothetical protein
MNASATHNTYENLHDVIILKNEVFLSSTTETVAYRKSNVTIRDYEFVDRAGNNYYPIIKADIAQADIPLSRYNIRPKEAELYYGQAFGSKLYRKFIVDNQIRCVAPTTYNIIALDIETYNETQYDQVPMIESSTAHIGIICMHI